MEYNIIETPIIPESPKLVPNEVLHVYVPVTNYKQPGVAVFDADYFEVESGGRVTLSLNTLKGRLRIDEKVDKISTQSESDDVYLFYSVDHTGEQTSLPGTHINRIGKTVVVRDENGNSSISEPIKPSHIASKNYVDELYKRIEIAKIVTELPSRGESNKIYLLLKTDENQMQSLDIYDEYIWINNRWEWITTKQLEVDLSPYPTRQELNNSIKTLKDYSDYTFANAFKGTTSGEIVALDDVSPLSHNVGVKLRSKNLIPYPYTNTTKTTNGITFTDNGDGSITINGTATANAFFDLCQNANSLPNGIEIGKTYAMTCQGRAEGVLMVCNYYPKGSSDYVNGGWILSTASPQPYVAKTIPNDMQGIFLYVLVQKDKTVNTTIYPQVELGTIGTAYTPYVADDTEVTLKVCGKNLFDIFATGKTRETKNGLTCEVLEDGRIHAYGKIEDTSGYTTISFVLPTANRPTYPAGTYIGWETSDKKIFTQFGYELNTSGTGNIQHGAKTLAESWRLRQLNIVVANNYADKFDVIISTQLEVGTVVTAYEPYNDVMQITTGLADGAELPSVSPNVTIFTDTVGVVVEANYNKDSNKVIEKLTQAIISLGGII